MCVKMGAQDTFFSSQPLPEKNVLSKSKSRTRENICQRGTERVSTIRIVKEGNVLD